MRTNKSLKIIAVMAAAALICNGCSDKNVPTVNNTNSVSGTTQTSESSNSSDNKENAKSINEIYQEIEQTVSLQSPQCMDDDFISNYYGIDAASLEEYVFSMSEDAAQAETVIIMKVKNTNDMEGLTDSLQTVVDEKKNEMENYIPEQFAIVEKSKVQTKENYIWLVISDNADAITDIIENGLF
ncbi:MAG: DUF4358 domain-containing protein [Lachnospiraceae bacterium]|nr:DUF4358 domain-containing protein [Lachnospiraceae bacterium]MDE7202733.1 DUF4358 domain-containing protein [Lachnospiraceae bacterium]